MRFMVMHKTDAKMEAGAPPDQTIIRGMGELVGGSLKAGVFLDGAGLHRSAVRVRLRGAGEACTVTRGPLVGDNELVAGFAMIKAASMEDAIGYARRFADARGGGEIEIGPVVEPWDLGIVPKPPTIERSRFLLLLKANPGYEAGGPPPASVGQGMGRVVDELTKEGVLVKMERLAPSARGARLAAGPKGKRTWVDGPFAESKELIAGFSILSLPSLEEAKAWANRYAAILEGNAVDVRVVLD